MPIPTSGGFGDSVEVPAGAQVEWRIKSAAFNPLGQYGPDLELDLEIMDNRYFGITTKYWARIQQPRLDKVRKLRKEGISDETIATVLRGQGYEFKKVDEKDALTVVRAGALYSILVARCGGDRKKAEEALQELD